ncbi:hypothetical protein SAY87_008140 [Trapa incisa]|uniref:Uncharacterized protein n=2 Tax=Trapa TaxID=22665 RepID=A0AAN7QV19_TRANT|nr:hypothetical protein SAY87_008140 [Trapa incisa]KAK4776298.1 hypothetical protein SAY86_004986 [Trapa natans]
MEAIQESMQPLLPGTSAPSEPGKQPKTPAQRAMRKTFKGTAHLSNLLPTGTVLAFQILSPVVTDQGRCPNTASWAMTLGVIVLSAASCFFCCFTDSVRDSRGKVRYGVATFKGLYIIDSSIPVVLSPEEAAKYRLRLIDFFHAFMTSLVFVAVALFDQKVVKCLYPAPSTEARKMLVAVPACIGIICSLFFIAFPSRRHGIGFPLSKE